MSPGALPVLAAGIRRGMLLTLIIPGVLLQSPQSSAAVHPLLERRSRVGPAWGRE